VIPLRLLYKIEPITNDNDLRHVLREQIVRLMPGSYTFGQNKKQSHPQRLHSFSLFGDKYETIVDCKPIVFTKKAKLKHLLQTKLLHRVLHCT